MRGIDAASSIAACSGVNRRSDIPRFSSICISDDAPTRIADYTVFASGWAADFIAQRDFRLSGMQGLRDRMRAT